MKPFWKIGCMDHPRGGMGEEGHFPSRASEIPGIWISANWVVYKVGTAERALH